MARNAYLNQRIVPLVSGPAMTVGDLFPKVLLGNLPPPPPVPCSESVEWKQLPTSPGNVYLAGGLYSYEFYRSIWVPRLQSNPGFWCSALYGVYQNDAGTSPAYGIALEGTPIPPIPTDQNQWIQWGTGFERYNAYYIQTEEFGVGLVDRGYIVLHIAGDGTILGIDTSNLTEWPTGVLSSTGIQHIIVSPDQAGFGGWWPRGTPNILHRKDDTWAPWINCLSGGFCSL